MPDYFDKIEWDNLPNIGDIIFSARLHKIREASWAQVLTSLCLLTMDDMWPAARPSHKQTGTLSYGFK